MAQVLPTRVRKQIKTTGDVKTMWMMVCILFLLGEVEAVILAVHLMTPMSTHTFSACGLLFASFVPFVSGWSICKKIKSNEELSEQSKIDFSYDVVSLISMAYVAFVIGTGLAIS